MSRVIAGQTNPFKELLRKNIKMAAFPKRPLQSFRVLRFLRIPPELTKENTASENKAFRTVGWSLGLVALAVMIYMYFVQ
jgi:hypothetical protein